MLCIQAACYFLMRNDCFIVRIVRIVSCHPFLLVPCRKVPVYIYIYIYIYIIEWKPPREDNLDGGQPLKKGQST